jgi:outer membrane lipoprotein-sorting protein
MHTSILAIVLMLSPGAQQNPSLESIMDRVSRNVQEFQNSLPDYTCTEKLVKNSALRLAPGMPQSQTMVSIVTGTRVSRGGETYFLASRQTQSVSGRGNGMVDLWSTLGDDVSRVFAPHNLRSNNYSFARRQYLRGIPAFVIDFETKPGQSSESRGGTLLQGGNPRLTMKGRAWIDSNSMQVLRLEFVEKLPVQRGSALLFDMKTSADYGSVDIGGRPFWLLTKIVKDDRGSEWIAEYSDCRKFEVTSEIRPVK